MGGFFNSIGSFLNDTMGVSDTANQSYKYNMKQWHAQNEYNHPKNQIARMAEAGIDVNPMTYAVGNGSMSTTASSPSAPTFSGHGVNPIATAINVISGLKGVEQRDAEIENTKAQTKLNTALIPQKIKQALLDLREREHNLRYAEEHNLPIGASKGWEDDLYYQFFPHLKNIGLGVINYLTSRLGTSNNKNKYADDPELERLIYGKGGLFPK